jgi:hypothetical protein
MTYKGLCTAYGIRTRVTAVKGRRPKPLDERGIAVTSVSENPCSSIMNKSQHIY